MRIAVYSDLHLELAPLVPPAELDADVIVLAGDIHLGSRCIEWARESFGAHPVVYFHGSRSEVVEASVEF